jgi:integrase
MSLTDPAIKAALPGDKPRKLYDTNGLYLIVQPSGSKLWRFKYRYGGVEKLISLGAYPDVGLKNARAKRDAARKSVAGGDNPSEQRQAERAKLDHTFGAVALEHLEQQAKKLDSSTLAKHTQLYGKYLRPYLGTRPIDHIDAPELLRALRKIEELNLTDTVFRVRTLASRIFRFGIATGRCSRDPAQDLRGAIVATPAEHRAAMTNKADVGALLRAIDGYTGKPSAAYALRLLPLVFLRSRELRGGEWSEINFDAAEWRIPGARMKGSRVNVSEEHIVPLSVQAVALLRELQAHTGHTRLLFPSLVSDDRPISENTLNGALKRLGYTSEQQTPHGFRTIASTLLNELLVDGDLIELQLAHKERNAVRGAYNRAQKLEARRAMMQQWADYLDSLKIPPPLSSLSSVR